MVHHTLVGGEHDESELSGWQNGVNEVLKLGGGEVKSWGDDTTLVKSSVEVHNDLSTTSIINDLEVVDVSVLLHLSEELDNDLGDWSKHNLKNKRVVNNQYIWELNHQMKAWRTGYVHTCY